MRDWAGLEDWANNKMNRLLSSVEAEGRRRIVREGKSHKTFAI